MTALKENSKKIPDPEMLISNKLIHAVQKKDEQAKKEFVLRLVQIAEYRTRFLISSHPELDREGIIQTAAMLAEKSIYGYVVQDEDLDKYNSYYKAIIKNAVLDECRRLMSRPEGYPVPNTTPEGQSVFDRMGDKTPQPDFDDTELLDLIYEKCNDIDCTNQRVIFEMWMSGFSSKEISAEIGVPVATIDTIVFRTKSTMFDYILDLNCREIHNRIEDIFFDITRLASLWIQCIVIEKTYIEFDSLRSNRKRNIFNMWLNKTPDFEIAKQFDRSAEEICETICTTRHYICCSVLKKGPLDNNKPAIIACRMPEIYGSECKSRKAKERDKLISGISRYILITMAPLDSRVINWWFRGFTPKEISESKEPKLTDSEASEIINAAHEGMQKLA